MADGHNELTEERIAELKSRLGVVWRPPQPYYNTTATKDSIRHFCHGIGDTNPLFTDVENIDEAQTTPIKG
jgi:hypothetical protein